MNMVRPAVMVTPRSLPFSTQRSPMVKPMMSPYQATLASMSSTVMLGATDVRDRPLVAAARFFGAGGRLAAGRLAARAAPLARPLVTVVFFLLAMLDLLLSETLSDPGHLPQHVVTGDDPHQRAVAPDQRRRGLA